MPEMHLFVGDKLKSIGRRAHSGRDFNDADANTVDLHQVEREKAMEVRVIATLQAKAGFEAAVSEAVHDIIEPSRRELGNLQYDLHRDLENRVSSCSLSVGPAVKRWISIMRRRIFSSSSAGLTASWMFWTSRN